MIPVDVWRPSLAAAPAPCHESKLLMSHGRLRFPIVKFPLLAIALQTAAIQKGSCELLFYEGFNYAVGEDNLTIQGGWTGSGNAGDIENYSLNWSDGQGNALLTTGNSCVLDGSGGGSSLSNTRPANFNALVDTDSTERWISFVGRQAAGTAGRFFNVALWAPDNTIRPFDSGSAMDEVLALGMPSGQPEGQYWRIWDRATGGAGWRFAVSPVPTSGQSFVVGRIQLNASGTLERFSIWVNPRLDRTPDDAEGAHFLSSDSDIQGWAELTTVRLGAGAVSGGQPASDFMVDEVRIGTRFADVSPHIPAPQLLGFLRTPDGASTLQWTALPGFADTLEYSENLTSWQAIQDYATPRITAETLQFTHQPAGNSGYYRIKRRPL